MAQQRRLERIAREKDRLEAAVRDGNDQARYDARNQIWELASQSFIEGRNTEALE